MKKTVLAASVMCALALCSCGTGDNDRSADSADSNDHQQAWSYTDDIGTTVDLDHRPETIASLLDGTTATLISRGVDVAASPLEDANDAMFEHAETDTGDIEGISTGTAMQIDVEKLASVEPDLIVDATAGDELLAASANEDIEDIAPVVGLNTGGPDTESILSSADRFADALTGDSGSGDDATDRYDTAAEELSAATRENPDVQVAVVMPTTNALWVNNPEVTPYLVTLNNLGVRFVPVSASEQSTVSQSEEISWEEVTDFPADIILSYGMWPVSQPGWDRIGAVRSGQVHNLDDSEDWAGGFALYTYDNYAQIFSRLAEVIRMSTRVGDQV